MTARKPVTSDVRGLTPDEALALLMDGNRRYLDAGNTPRDYRSVGPAGIRERPSIAAILGCADARIGAEMFFDRAPGDLFMVRLAGNFLADEGLASMEFCVEFLKVPLLLVLGHTHCGAVTSALRVIEEGIDLPGRLFVLIDAIEPSVLYAKMTHPNAGFDALLRAATEENVRRQVRRLRSISPVINAAQAAGKVKVVGAIYDMDTGKVNPLDEPPAKPE